MNNKKNKDIPFTPVSSKDIWDKKQKKFYSDDNKEEVILTKDHYAHNLTLQNDILLNLNCMLEKGDIDGENDFDFVGMKMINFIVDKNHSPEEPSKVNERVIQAKEEIKKRQAKLKTLYDVEDDSKLYDKKYTHHTGTLLAQGRKNLEEEPFNKSDFEKLIYDSNLKQNIYKITGQEYNGDFLNKKTNIFYDEFIKYIYIYANNLMFIYKSLNDYVRDAIIGLESYNKGNGKMFQGVLDHEWGKLVNLVNIYYSEVIYNYFLSKPYPVPEYLTAKPMSYVIDLIDVFTDSNSIYNIPSIKIYFTNLNVPFLLNVFEVLSVIRNDLKGTIMLNSFSNSNGNLGDNLMSITNTEKITDRVDYTFNEFQDNSLLKTFTAEDIVFKVDFDAVNPINAFSKVYSLREFLKGINKVEQDKVYLEDFDDTFVPVNFKVNIKIPTPDKNNNPVFLNDMILFTDGVMAQVVKLGTKFYGYLYGSISQYINSEGHVINMDQLDTPTYNIRKDPYLDTIREIEGDFVTIPRDVFDGDDTSVINRIVYIYKNNFSTK